ncbi:hypothetical protein UA08_08818 [Talaromyces atroroseus]|uniref:Uncharacterized protein n=1 Tax=Talaromyces atroroseus TaxID=1441469 RepID=A0A225AQU4_TALAT|nr:hypothetical protein UA08_08818 [Talaromyces atroroseus]OKL55827.1 hypothetical protein UA08_08818 [Talaromyces atroroseus]
MVFLGAVVLLSTLICGWAVELSELLPLEKRQDLEPGTPLYECHASCGYAILISESSNYCSNSTFTSDLSSCLECALTYDIWQYYGSEVSSAATACGDDATPSSSSATVSASATGSPYTSTVVVATTSSTAFSSTSSTAAIQTPGSQAGATGTASNVSTTSSVAASQYTGAASSLTSDRKWAFLIAVGVLEVFHAYM